MNEIIEHLDAAYSWLSRINVNGESVDYLAMARQELRAAYKLAKEGSDGR